MDNLTIVVRLLLSFALGGIVGYQREAVDRPAGFRTHVLVCLGSTLITLVSIAGFPDSDTARVAAQIVTGIGFLGAGTIIRQGSIVRGLTTAASIWAVAGVGIAIGTGFYLGSVLSTAIIYIVLSYGKRMEREFIPQSVGKQLIVKTINKPGQYGKIDQALGRENISLEGITTIDESGDELSARFAIKVPPNTDMEIIKSRISEIEGVNEITWEDRIE